MICICVRYKLQDAQTSFGVVLQPLHNLLNQTGCECGSYVVQLIERANEWAKELKLSTAVSFQHANATVSLASMLATYPGQLQLATIQARFTTISWLPCSNPWDCTTLFSNDPIMQFPDPHFKMRHKKRRIVQPQLIAALAELMPSQGKP